MFHRAIVDKKIMIGYIIGATYIQKYFETKMVKYPLLRALFPLAPFEMQMFLHSGMFVED